MWLVVNTTRRSPHGDHHMEITTAHHPVFLHWWESVPWWLSHSENLASNLHLCVGFPAQATVSNVAYTTLAYGS